ncbi:hypothetical protein BZA02_101813 [Ruegeria sp. P4]|nr:hypothetical protein BZA02_101813 [Ruegeria sp. P4]
MLYDLVASAISINAHQQSFERNIILRKPFQRGFPVGPEVRATWAVSIAVNASRISCQNAAPDFVSVMPLRMQVNSRAP